MAYKKGRRRRRRRKPKWNAWTEFSKTYRPTRKDWHGVKTLVRPPPHRNEKGEMEADKRPFLQRLYDRAFKGKV